ncbi:MAG: cell wall-binding repeat-containing protein [Lachnospiraceae bacterium]|nr:cell wall-binding repeat-containing protein [Lachnospiraceae bacterium]
MRGFKKKLMNLTLVVMLVATMMPMGSLTVLADESDGIGIENVGTEGTGGSGAGNEGTGTEGIGGGAGNGVIGGDGSGSGIGSEGVGGSGAEGVGSGSENGIIDGAGSGSDTIGGDGSDGEGSEGDGVDGDDLDSEDADEANGEGTEGEGEDGEGDPKDEEELRPKEGTALYFIPHQDDELLTFSISILKDLAANLDVHVVLLTDGSRSSVFNQLKNRGYNLTRGAFVRARDTEFTCSLMALGVPEANIHIPENRLKDSDVSMNIFTLKNMMAEYLNEYPDAVVRACYPTSGFATDEHLDHGSVGQMAITLRREGFIGELILFEDPYRYQSLMTVGVPPMNSMTVAADSEDAAKLKAAVDAYYVWNPKEGRYSIGGLSSDYNFRKLLNNRINYYYVHHDENMVRYGGNSRYETATMAAAGETMEGTSEVNYAAPGIERQEGQMPENVSESAAVLVYDDAVVAPNGGNGTSPETIGSVTTPGGTVVVACGGNFPDALAATSLGYQIVLSRKSSLPEETRREILRTMPGRIIIVGGDVVVSKAVEEALRNIGASATQADIKAIAGDDTTATRLVYTPDVQRSSGSTRQETALSIIRNYGFNSTEDTVIVVTGSNFADALSIAPYAAKTHSPILLATKAGLLNDVTKKAISDLGDSVKKALVIGGPNVVGKDAESFFNEAGIKVTRLYGASRYETSAKVAAFEIEAGVGLSFDDFSVATGGNFPDALVAGPLVASQGHILLLVSSKVKTGESVLKLIREHRDEISDDYRFNIFGSYAAVSADTAQVILTAIG